ncbi:hypothetical protein [Kozakia baliensis]|uniref:Type III secretion protein n=1 Tax=Kozakia baliensis TaxID=153496 RepID=A0A1D8UT14_9PROT|nr:hypothetical protein [Kozakia baliensis]AOX16637.1 hypothetical protein A0U89_05300 [Kozakia baliensis]GBR26016.1 hypothetical protein AA0488_0801 [Kozakia baliensis NRIC 0488]
MELRWMLVGSAAVFLTLRPVSAEPLHLPGHGHYTVLNQTLPDVLTQFCEDVGVRAIVDPAIGGHVRSGFAADNPRAFFDALTAEYRLDWYYDGDALYVTPSAATVAHSIPLNGIPYPTLMRALSDRKIDDARFPIRVEAGERSIMVFGPPRLLERIQQTIQSLGGRSGAHGITIYRGGAVQQVNPR